LHFAIKNRLHSQVSGARLYPINPKGCFTMSNLADAPSASGQPVARAVPSDLPVLQSRDLFATQREVLIQHGTDHYRLRLTSTNKLILTK